MNETENGSRQCVRSGRHPRRRGPEAQRQSFTWAPT
jgi:hypothetical protein